MKNTFKRAHEMAREIKRKYPEVDYRTQFGICLSYLLNNKEEEEMEFIKKEENTSDYEDGMLVLTTSNRQRAWVAEINGLDSRFGFKRDFNEPDLDEGRVVSFVLEEGKIYNWEQGKRQYFGIIENGKLFEISKRDVENLIAK